MISLNDVFDSLKMGQLKGLYKVPGLLLAALAVTPSLFAFYPDGSVPPNLNESMPSTWDLSKMTNQLWVDASASVGGDGSEEAPFATIMDAVAVATPGTVILVKTGTYEESVSLPVSTADGSDSAPILLVSADGIEAATIQPPKNKSGVSSDKNSNWGVIGFHIVTNVGKGDESPVKIGGRFIDDVSTNYNWFIAGNRLSGRGNDGIKCNAGRGFYCIGNTLEGDFKDEQVDWFMVGVVSKDQYNQLGFNTIKGYAPIKPASGFTLKGGTNHCLVYNNIFAYEHVEGNSTALRMGNQFGGKFSPPSEEADPDFWPKTANHIDIIYNEFSGNFGRGIAINGARHITLKHNDFSKATLRGNEVGDGEYTNKSDGYGPITPESVTLEYNKLTGPDFMSDGGNPKERISTDAPWYETYSVKDNDNTQTFDYPLGAEPIKPLVEALIKRLRDGQ